MSLQGRHFDLAFILARDNAPSAPHALLSDDARQRLTWPAYRRLTAEALEKRLQADVDSKRANYVGARAAELSSEALARGESPRAEPLRLQALVQVERERPWLFPHARTSPRAAPRASAGDNVSLRRALRSMSDAQRATYFSIEIASACLGREVDAEEAERFVAAEPAAIRAATAAAKAGERAKVSSLLSSVRKRWQAPTAKRSTRTARR